MRHTFFFSCSSHLQRDPFIKQMRIKKINKHNFNKMHQFYHIDRIYYIIVYNSGKPQHLHMWSFWNEVLVFYIFII